MLVSEDILRVKGVADKGRFVLFMRLVVMHRAAFTQAKSSMSDQARMLAGLCCLLQVCHRGFLRGVEALLTRSHAARSYPQRRSAF